MSRQPDDSSSIDRRRPELRVGAYRGLHVRRWTVAAAATLAVTGGAHALSLGSLVVRSAQGEPLVADIVIDTMSSAEQASLQARIASPDTFRAAGLVFEPALRGAQMVLARDAQGRTVLRLTGQVPAQSTFVDLIVEASWASGRLVREFTMLLPSATVSSGAQTGSSVATQPVVVSPPVLGAALPAASQASDTPAPDRPAAATDAVPEPVAPPAGESAGSDSPKAPSGEAPAAAQGGTAADPAPTATPPATSASSATATAPVAVPPRDSANTASAAAVDAPRPGAYVVRPGDTLSKIARQHAVEGSQPEQHWVGILRSNPKAFAQGNVNRLLSGRTLTLPTDDEVRAVDEAQAKALVAEQRLAFEAERRRLAAVASTATPPADKAQRSQGAVRELPPTVAASPAPPPTPDRLELSKSSASPAQAQQERKAAEAQALKAAQEREAELRRNLEALQQLQAERAQLAKTPASTSPAAGANAQVADPATTASPATSATAPTVVAELSPAPAATPSPPPAEVNAPPTQVQAQPTAGSAATPAGAEPAPVPASAAAAADTPSPTDTSHEADRMQNWLNSAWAIPVAAILALLVIAAGAWGVWRRSRRLGGNDPASADAALADELGSPSEQDMLGELGALSDVDPVAEADVYLAYGRDRQAEEILREALAADAGNLRFHGKLLEILALRKDTATFVEQAQVVADLTGREGRDWAQVAVFGRQLAPDLPLFAATNEPWMEPEQDLQGAGMAPGSGEAPVWPELADDVPARGAEGSTSRPEPPRDSEFPAGLSDFGDDTPLALDEQALGERSTPLADDAARSDLPGPASPTQDWPESPQDPEVDLGMDALGEGADVASSSSASGELVGDGSQPSAEEVWGAEAGDEPGAAEPGVRSDAPQPADAFPGGVDPFEGLSLDLDVPEDDPVEPNADVMARKLSLAEEFVQLGDQDGAAELLREVVAQAEDEAQRAQAQDRLDRLS